MKHEERQKRINKMKECIIDAIHSTNNIGNINGTNYNPSDEALLKIAKLFYDKEKVKA